MGAQGSQILVLLGIGLFVFVLINRVRRSVRASSRTLSDGSPWRSRRLPASTADNRGRTASARLRSREQESWEVEMHKLARELKAEIDTKMRALEQLIQLADEACGELHASIERAESLGLIEEDASARNSVERRDSVNKPMRATDRALGRLAAGQSARTDPMGARLRLGESLTDDPRFERVYALADAGFSANKIASQVGSQVGEVELILSLRSAQSA